MIPKEIILHCSATAEGKEFHASDIDAWHRQRGFKKIGYHYFITLDGKVEKGRGDKEVGAHCVGHNSKAIGICYCGGVAKDGKTAKDTRTEQQKEAMYSLVDKLMKEYNLSLEKVHGHYEFANKACPSFKIEKFRKEFNEWKNGKTVLFTNTMNGKFMDKLFSFVLKIINFLSKK